MAGLVTNVENGWTIISKNVTLPATCRRLRHLRSVLVRHMAHTGKLIDSYYTLETDTGEQLYKSECCEGTLNPVWADIPQTLPGNNKALSTFKSQKYTIKIFSSDEEELMSQSIHLGNMKLLASNVSKLGFIGSAQLLFEFEDGVFAAEESNDSLATEGSETPEQVAAHFDVCSCTFEPPEVTASQSFCDIKYSIMRLTSLAKAIDASKATLMEYKDKIKTELDAHSTRRKMMLEIEFREDHVSALTTRKAEAEERLRKLQKQLVVSTESNNQLRETLSRARASYETRVERQLDLTNEIVQLKQKKERTHLQIRDRKNLLVQNLREVFPIQVNRQSLVLTVSNMHLNSKESNSNSQATYDEAATSLGYVTHCLLLLSRIWGIPLRHNVYPISSRSYVHEQRIDSKPDLYPLFCTRGTDKHKYFQSILLLNKNVRQLLQVRGLTQLDPKQLLFNLKELLESNQDTCSEEE